MKNNNITWKTKDGRKIPIEDLGDDHLINIIHMIEDMCHPDSDYVKSRVLRLYSLLELFNGGCAEDDLDDKIDVLETYGADPVEVYENYDDLLSVAHKRGLL
jgi:hypothetical protein